MKTPSRTNGGKLAARGALRKSWRIYLADQETDQRQMARRWGVSESWLSMVVNGRRTLARTNPLIEKICSAVHLDRKAAFHDLT